MPYGSIDVNLIYYILAALVYVILSSYAINRFTDMKRVRAFNEEMKKLQSEFWTATKKNDIKKMDELNKKQIEKSKEFPFLFKEQLKMSIISLFIFLLFFSVLDYIDLNKRDDIKTTIDEKGKILYIREGRHFLNYETLDKSLRGEIYYEAYYPQEMQKCGSNNKCKNNGINNVFNISDKLNIKIDIIKEENSSLLQANVSSSLPLHITDDNATRTEIEIKELSLNIHGLWLFILFSIIISLVKNVVKL